jgi:hypothetical protein
MGFQYKEHLHHIKFLDLFLIKKKMTTIVNTMVVLLIAVVKYIYFSLFIIVLLYTFSIQLVTVS